MKSDKLTPEEERVIVHKGTEAPFSGEYDDHFVAGTYVCRRCGTPLYRSDDKFRSGCGWPSFDREFSGGVIKPAEEEGERTEIRGAAGGAHLGHFFRGEKFREKDPRH